MMKRTLLSLLAGLLPGCAHINVMGRKVTDGEYKAIYDADIEREKKGLLPGGAHDEFGRAPSWSEYWRIYAGPNPVPPTAQSRRLKRYIINRRRAEGLPELPRAE